MDLKHKIKDEAEPSNGDQQFDKSTIFPTVNSVLDKNCEDIACYDLDILQDELESLLHSFQKQFNELSKEATNSIENVKVTNNGNLKMSTTKDKTPEKILEGTPKQSSSSRARSRPVKSQDLEFSLKSDMPKPLKSDTSGRFWSFVEPYCADITLDDIKMLEKWIESHENDSEYQFIPTLGQHYSSVWTENDILEEIREGSKSVENPKGLDCNSIEDISGENLLKRAKDENLYLNSEPPPLIEKLMLSLVHENIIASSDVMTETIPENNTSEVTKEDPKCPYLFLEDTLENRLYSQFEEIGVLEAPVHEADDELLTELKQLQALLIPVARRNLKKKKDLLERAKAEIDKQESQKRIQEADAKVTESYRVMSVARSKGKKLSKMEYFQIRTMLEDREILIKSLENTKDPKMPKVDCHIMDES